MVQNMLVKDRCTEYPTLKSNISKSDIKEMDVFVGVTGETEKSLNFFLQLPFIVLFSKGPYYAALKVQNVVLPM